METCDRCLRPIENPSEHGVWICPLELPRPGTRATQYFQDHVPGGFWIENMTPQPLFFESKSAHRKKMKELGLIERVRHVGTRGSDRNPYTQRWI